MGKVERSSKRPCLIDKRASDTHLIEGRFRCNSLAERPGLRVEGLGLEPTTFKNENPVTLNTGPSHWDTLVREDLHVRIEDLHVRIEDLHVRIETGGQCDVVEVEAWNDIKDMGLRWKRSSAPVDDIW
jgi:hypothetical protein